MTDVIDDEKAVVDLDTVRPRPALSDATNDELVRLLAERARAEGLRLAGEGGLLSQLTKRVVEAGPRRGARRPSRLRQARSGRPRRRQLAKRQAREDRVDGGGSGIDRGAPRP